MLIGLGRHRACLVTRPFGQPPFRRVRGFSIEATGSDAHNEAALLQGPERLSRCILVNVAVVSNVAHRRRYGTVIPAVVAPRDENIDRSLRRRERQPRGRPHHKMR